MDGMHIDSDVHVLKDMLQDLLSSNQRDMADLEEKLSVLKHQGKLIRQSLDTATEITGECAQGNWCGAVRLAERVKEMIRSIDMFPPEVMDGIGRFRDTAMVEAVRALDGLSVSVPETLKSAGLMVDSTSRFPIFKIKNGFFEVKINKNLMEASIAVRHGKTKKCAADSLTISKNVLLEYERCFVSKYVHEDFASRLKFGYLKATSDGQLPPVHLDRVRMEMDGKRLGRDEFSAAIANYMQNSGGSPIKFKLDHTKDHESGYLLPGYEDRGYFGYISFSN